MQIRYSHSQYFTSRWRPRKVLVVERGGVWYLQPDACILPRTIWDAQRRRRHVGSPLNTGGGSSELCAGPGWLTGARSLARLRQTVRQFTLRDLSSATRQYRIQTTEREIKHFLIGYFFATTTTLLPKIKMQKILAKRFSAPLNRERQGRFQPMHFTFNRSFAKLFGTASIYVVKECQMPSCVTKKKHDMFHVMFFS